MCRVHILLATSLLNTCDIMDHELSNIGRRNLEALEEFYSGYVKSVACFNRIRNLSIEVPRDSLHGKLDRESQCLQSRGSASLSGN